MLGIHLTPELSCKGVNKSLLRSSKQFNRSFDSFSVRYTSDGTRIPAKCAGGMTEHAIAILKARCCWPPAVREPVF